MNERIDEIAFEAGCHRHKYWDPKHPDLEGFIISQATLDKFAQLIVREMCGMMEQCQDDISSDEPSEVNWGYVSQLGDWIERFKKHFGVKP